MAFKILSIDGGGLRGLVPVLILKEVEKRTNKRIVDLFDMVAGASAGAFIACGVTVSEDGKTLKSTLDDIEKVYTERGKEIFPPRNIFQKIAAVFNPKYTQDGVKNILNEMAGDLTMRNCIKPIFIPTYDLNNNEAILFKTRQAEEDRNADARLMDICCATSAAPTFYPPYKFFYKGKDRVCIDGGIFMNNPSLGAMAEVSKYRDYYKVNDFSEISVLSLGTGSYTDNVAFKKAEGWGLIEWAAPITDVIMQAVAQTTNYGAEEFLEEGRFLRVTIKIDEKKYSDFTNTSPETVNYLRDKVRSDITENNEVMQQLIDFVTK